MKDHEEIVTLEPATAGSPSAPDSTAWAWFASNQRVIGYAVGGAGLAAIVVGAYFGLRSKSTYDEATSQARCPGGLSNCDQAGVDGVDAARSEAAVSTVAFIAGGAFLAGGAALVLTAPRVGRVSLAPAIDRTTATLRLGGVF
jgi:hypothetical protein